MINWARLPAGASFQAHYHEDMQEVFIIISGQAHIQVDQESAVLGSGDTVIIPARSVHIMRNTGGKDVEYIALGISSEGRGRTVVM